MFGVDDLLVVAQASAENFIYADASTGLGRFDNGVRAGEIAEAFFATGFRLAIVADGFEPVVLIEGKIVGQRRAEGKVYLPQVVGAVVGVAGAERLRLGFVIDVKQISADAAFSAVLNMAEPSLAGRRIPLYVSPIAEDERSTE